MRSSPVCAVLSWPVSLPELGQRTASVAESLAQMLSSWDEVEAVSVMTYGDDRYDPYLALSFDTYVTGEVRSPELRHEVFAEAGAFESAILTSKDRFLVGEIPVRVEYKSTERFDSLVRNAGAGHCRLRGAGTYAFHRLTASEVRYSLSGWIESLRASLVDLPDGFWREVQLAQRASLEHVYADLQAACARQDAFYFTITSGRFALRAAAALFATRREFEPSPRVIAKAALALPHIPSSFAANFEHFARVDSELSMVQRCEIAGFVVNDILGLFDEELR